MEEGHALALPFDTNDHEFARGVEIGRLWEQLKADPAVVVQDVHAANAEMVLRISDAVGRPVSSEDLDATWLRVTFAEERSAP